MTEQITVYAVITCIQDDPDPCWPDLYLTRAAASEALDERMRGCWTDWHDEPWPGSWEKANDFMSEKDENWGRFDISSHQLPVSEVIEAIMLARGKPHDT